MPAPKPQTASAGPGQAPPQTPADTVTLAGRGRYAFVDLATTGCAPIRDAIIGIAILTVEDGQLIDTWPSLAQPETRLPPTIERLNGWRIRYSMFPCLTIQSARGSLLA
jgi:hypothetical protein